MATRYNAPGSFKTVESFRACLQSIDSGFTCDDTVERDGPLAQPVTLAGSTSGASDPSAPVRREPLTLANRFAIQPMEGWDGTHAGGPTDHTLRRWRRFGASGAGLIWGGEAVAVSHDGRANPNQLYFNPDSENLQIFQNLRAAVLESFQEHFPNDRPPIIGLQLTHSGRFARPNGRKLEPMIADYHPLYAQKYGLADDHPILSDGELQRIRDQFIAGARVAQRVGFDFVDVKCCHAYLLHELLGARRRAGRYGGPLENRTRLLREIIEGIQVECPGLHVGVRLGLTDLPPHHVGPDGRGLPLDYQSCLPWTLGFGMDSDDPMSPDWTEPQEVLRLLRSLGVQLLNCSVGTPYGSPHLLRPAAFPPSDGYWPPVDPLVSVYQQIRSVRMIKEHFPDFIVVGSGYTYLQDYLPHVAQHEVRQGFTDLVGLGRMVLSYPEMPADVLAGRPLQRKRICRTFSDCTTGPRNYLLSGCFPLDPYYKAMDEAQLVKLQRQTMVKKLQ